MQKNLLILTISLIMGVSLTIGACDYALNGIASNPEASISAAIAHLSQYDTWQKLQEDCAIIAEEAIKGLQEDSEDAPDLTNPLYENNETYLKRVFNNKTFEHHEWEKILRNYYEIRRDVLRKALDDISY